MSIDHDAHMALVPKTPEYVYVPVSVRIKRRRSFLGITWWVNKTITTYEKRPV